MQVYDAIMCGYFDLSFTDFMLSKKRVIDVIRFFSPNSFKENYEKILDYFQLA